MIRNWTLNVEQDPSQGDCCSIRLDLADTATGQVMSILSVAPSPEAFSAFSAQVSELKGELDRLMDKARKEIQAIEIRTGKRQAFDSGSAWKALEALPTDQAMVESFNGLPETERRQVAEYVFSQVSMFKGRGPVFSELYDSGTHLLEQEE